MSNLLKALNELREVNLSSERIDMASVSDLKSQSKKINSEHNRLLDFEDKVGNSITKLKVQAQDIISNGDKINTMLNEFAKKAKDLGLNPENVKEYKDLKAEVKTAIETGKDINKVY